MLQASDLQYFVFSNGRVPGKYTKQYELVYNFWQNEWSKIFQKIDPEFRLIPEDFKKQSRINAIFYKDDVVAMQTLSDHTFDEIMLNPYFKPYTVEFIQELEKFNIKKFQSMQFFLVGERYGVRATGMNLSAVILGLSFVQQQHYNFEASVTLARKDVASASTAAKFNMFQVGSDIQMHNVPVGQLLCIQPKPHPREEVAKIIDQLWDQQINFYTNNQKEFNNEQVAITV